MGDGYPRKQLECSDCIDRPQDSAGVLSVPSKRPPMPDRHLVFGCPGEKFLADDLWHMVISSPFLSIMLER